MVLTALTLNNYRLFSPSFVLHTQLSVNFYLLTKARIWIIEPRHALAQVPPAQARCSPTRAACAFPRPPRIPFPPPDAAS